MEEGGEPVCLIPQIDAEGAIPDPRQLVRPLIGPREAVAWTVLAGAASQEIDVDEVIPALAPRPGESVAAYRRRLTQPEARTAAWRIALKTEERPVSIAMEEGSTELLDALVKYVRDLIS